MFALASSSAAAVRVPVASAAAPRTRAARAATASSLSSSASSASAPLRARCCFVRGPSSSSSSSSVRRGSLQVRADAIDDAVEIATKGPNTGPKGPVASDVVPALPRSTCSDVVDSDGGFNLATTSFGTIGLSVGLPLLSYGFFSFFNFLPGGSVSSLLLIYGFIISLIGFALKYAQLDPLECVTYRVRRDGRRRSLAPRSSRFIHPVPFVGR